MTQTADEQLEFTRPSLADSIRARLVVPMPTDRARGWAATIIVGAIAALLRMIDLGRPGNLIFDETYYAKDAYSLLKFGYARSFVEDADDRILDGNFDVFTDEPSFVVHPPIGKWLIALGIRLFGMDPTGWRVATAVAGVVTVVVVTRVGRRLFRSTLLGSAAGLMLAVDGLSIVMSRTALLDGFLAMFIISAFACLLVDRDRVRSAYADWAATRLAAGQNFGNGPVFGWRPWRLAAGVLLGLACGTKWSGIYALAVFGIMTVLWELGARRAVGIRSPALNSVLGDGPIAFATMVGAALVTYVASWSGWIASDNGWGRQWAAGNPADGLTGLLPDWLRSLWHYHQEMWTFHRTLTTDHPYESDAWSWLILGRPVSFDYQTFTQGEAGCEVAKCSQEVLALGTPVLWWAACVALLVGLWRWFIHRDWRAGAILAGITATWVPWLPFNDRTTFSFYAVTIVPFLVLAVAYGLGLLIGPPEASPNRRKVGVILATAFVVSVVVVAGYFYPIHVDQVIPYGDWKARMWLGNWI